MSTYASHLSALSSVCLLPVVSHLLQTVYILLTVEILKGSFLERVRLLLSVPRPRRW